MFNVKEQVSKVDVQVEGCKNFPTEEGCKARVDVQVEGCMQVPMQEKKNLVTRLVELAGDKDTAKTSP